MHLEISGVRYYSTSAILNEADISRQTFWRWRRENVIPRGHRFRTGRLLFTEREYRKILEYANRVEPESFGPRTDWEKASP